VGVFVLANGQRPLSSGSRFIDLTLLSPSLSLIPWNEPLPRAGAAWLAESLNWAGNGPLDLKDYLVIVPTRQSGRRLREALATLAARHQQAAFPPRVIVPEMLPAALAELSPSATRLELTLAWADVLLTINLPAYRAVIPVDPPRRDFAWAYALATRLVKVQQELAEGILSMTDVADRNDTPEVERWQQMAYLERRVEHDLNHRGLGSRGEVERCGEATAKVPMGFRKIVLLGAPDVLPVAIRYLEKIKHEVPIYVLVAGPAGANSTAEFDRWGRPVPECWIERVVELEDYDYQVGLKADPSDQARDIAALADTWSSPDEWLAVAIGDAEISAPLELELAARNLPSFKPEGTRWKHTALFAMVKGFADLVRAPTAEAIGQFLRCPDLLACLAHGEENFEVATLLQRWDRLCATHLVPDLATARQRAEKWPQLSRVLDRFLGWRRKLQEENFADGACAVLAEVYAHQTLAVGSVLAEGATQWVETVKAVEQAAKISVKTELGDLWRLAIDAFGEAPRFEVKPVGAIELGGWLELLWADAPHAVIGGCNEGKIPDSVQGDPFLPEGLRVTLGLKTNAQRQARDAYVLAAAIGQRPSRHGVRILVGKTAASGEPLRPSRLLLNGAGPALPARVRHLFREIEASSANLSWQRAWSLNPRWKTPPDTVSVTALRDWLACPFRFYLRHVLKMEVQELAKVELDARDFGTLVHGALQDMGENGNLRDCGDFEILRQGLWDALDRSVRSTWGSELNLPLVIQLESAKQRLAKAAMVQAEIRTEGWRIDRVEWAFAIPLGGLIVRGKVDRIDRHPDGRVRVIDYKTSDKQVAPIEAHLASLRADDLGRADWLKTDFNGREKRWVDLQLPLYRRALAEEFGPGLECCYFNLPKAISDTSLAAWPSDLPELQASAEKCAEHVAAAIVAREFWPPMESMGRRDDDWLGLFHQGTAASIASDWIGREVAT
jgi:ATP-dependent helicase/nuclease subunit B